MTTSGRRSRIPPSPRAARTPPASGSRRPSHRAGSSGRHPAPRAPAGCGRQDRTLPRARPPSVWRSHGPRRTGRRCGRLGWWCGQTGYALPSHAARGSARCRRGPCRTPVRSVPSPGSRAPRATNRVRRSRWRTRERQRSVYRGDGHGQREGDGHGDSLPLKGGGSLLI